MFSPLFQYFFSTQNQTESPHIQVALIHPDQEENRVSMKRLKMESLHQMQRDISELIEPESIAIPTELENDGLLVWHLSKGKQMEMSPNHLLNKEFHGPVVLVRRNYNNKKLPYGSVDRGEAIRLTRAPTPPRNSPPKIFIVEESPEPVRRRSSRLRGKKRKNYSE